MTYDELCKSLGIDREVITKACADPLNGAICKEKGIWGVPMGKRVQTNRVDEDVSHLVTPLARRISNRLRAKPRRSKKTSK